VGAQDPPQGSHILKKLMEENPAIEPGETRSLSFQALVQVPSRSRLRSQLIGLGITMFVSIVLGALTGLFISNKKIFDPIPDDQLFDDEVFWELADDDSAGFQQPDTTGKRASISRRRSRARSTSKDLTHDVAIKSISVSGGRGTVHRQEDNFVLAIFQQWTF
jgi:uncharacterized protein YneF (UPF0154 family)